VCPSGAPLHASDTLCESCGADSLSSCHLRSLRDGEGDWVDKPPWRITWGGGASVESPHFQRVHYCELLVRDGSAMVRALGVPAR
jgi:hypothetical protein